MINLTLINRLQVCPDIFPICRGGKNNPGDPKIRQIMVRNEIEESNDILEFKSIFVNLGLLV